MSSTTVPVLWIGAYRLVGRPRLEHALVASFDVLRSDMTAAVTGWSSPAPAASRGRGPEDMLIDNHEVVEEAVLPRTLWEGTLDDIGHLPPQTVTVTAVVGPHGVGAVVVRLLLEPGDLLDEVEATLTRELSAPVRDLAKAQSRVLTDKRLLAVEQPGGRDLPQGVLLWWHRLLDARLQQATDRACQLDGSERVALRPGVDLQVADGYSCLYGADEADRRGVVQGLLQATELWLVSDRLQRRLSERTAQLLRNDSHDLKQLQARALSLSESSELQGQLLAEQLRYTTGTALLTLEAAGRSWRTALDLGPLIGRAAQLENAVGRRLEEQRAEQDRRSGRLLAGIAVISGLAVLLSLFETAFGGVLDYGNSTRLVFSGLVLLMSGVVIGLALRHETVPSKGPDLPD